jgi:hypothetical protein
MSTIKKKDSMFPTPVLSVILRINPEKQLSETCLSGYKRTDISFSNRDSNIATSPNFTLTQLKMRSWFAMPAW